MCAIFIVFYLSSHFALSQESKGPIFQSLGGSGRAAADPVEVGRTNPASLAQLQDYYLGFGVSRGSSKALPDVSAYNVTLADGTLDVAFPGSFTYERSRISDDFGLRADGQLFHLALAGLLGKGLSLGLSAHRFDFRPEGGDRVYDDNFDLGLLWAINPSLAFGLVVDNLLGFEDKLPVGLQTYTTAHIGAQYVVNEFLRFRGDYSYQLEENSNNRGRLAYGVESQFIGDFKFRLGNQLDGLKNRTLITTGLGWDGPRLRIDYAFQANLRDGGGQVHSLDLWLNF